nr:acyltransferase [Propioniciclava soli]
MSSQVHLWTAQHEWRSPSFDYVTAPIRIDDYVWVGPRVTILPGAHLGEGCVVAAHAVVRGEVAPYTLVGGVPATKLGERPRGLDYTPAGPGAMTWWW